MDSSGCQQRGEAMSRCYWGAVLLLTTMGSLALAILIPIAQVYHCLRYLGAPFLVILLSVWLCAFIVLLVRIIRKQRWGRWRDCLLGLLLVALSGAIAVMATQPGFVIMDDEGTLLNTALSIYETGEVFSAHRGYWLEGDFEIVDGRLDKRPALYPLLLAVCHHIFGYNLANGFYLNWIFALIGVGFFWLMLRQLFGVGIASVALLPFLWNPLWVQSMFGAGLDPLNLSLMLVVGWAMCLVAQRSFGGVAEVFLLASCVLLAYARYESVFWVLPVGIYLFIHGGGLRGYQPSFAVILAPLSLVAAVWLLRTTLARSDAFQAAGSESLSAFSLSHIWGNLQDAAIFTFSPSWTWANDLFLVVVGTVGLALIFWRFGLAFKDRKTGANLPLYIICWLSGFLLLLLFYQIYFWSSFRDVLSVRLSLVIVPPLVFGWAYLLSVVCARFAQARWILCFCALCSLLLSAPNLASLVKLRDANPHARLQNWKREWLLNEQPNQLNSFFIDNHSQVWTAARYSAISYEKMSVRLSALSHQMKAGRFTSVYYVETLRRDSSDGSIWKPVLSGLRGQLQFDPEISGSYQLDARTCVQLRRVTAIIGDDAERAIDVPFDPWYLP